LDTVTLKSKQALKSGPDNLNLSADGTVADLKHRIKSHIDDLKQSGVNDKNLILNKEIKPCILTKADDDLAFCCSDHDKSLSNYRAFYLSYPEKEHLLYINISR
jgi:hypothetical protein